MIIRLCFPPLFAAAGSKRRTGTLLEIGRLEMKGSKDGLGMGSKSIVISFPMRVRQASAAMKGFTA